MIALQDTRTTRLTLYMASFGPYIDLAAGPLQGANLRKSWPQVRIMVTRSREHEAHICPGANRRHPFADLAQRAAECLLDTLKRGPE